MGNFRPNSARKVVNTDERCMSHNQCMAYNRKSICRYCGIFQTAMAHARRCAGHITLRLKSPKTDRDIIQDYLDRSLAKTLEEWDASQTVTEGHD